MGVLYKLKPRKTNLDFAHVKCCFLGIIKRIFDIVFSDEINPKKRKDFASTLIAKPNIHGKIACCVFGKSAKYHVL